jgi:hypothetical protein
MGNSKETNPFIFYLTLDENLPSTFYTFDRCLKNLNFILVPVKIDQLQKLLSFADQSQIVVICSVTDSREFKLYNEKVRPLLKYVLKSKRLTFMHLSSFSKINDGKTYTMSKNYYFMKYPLDAVSLSAKIAHYHDLKSETNIRWPGGKRAGLGAVA